MGQQPTPRTLLPPTHPLQCNLTYERQSPQVAQLQQRHRQRIHMLLPMGVHLVQRQAGDMAQVLCVQRQAPDQVQAAQGDVLQTGQLLQRGQI
jgi:hypothetical protein